jgi:ABC-type multidrug transport system ATPase subunit
MTAVAVRSLDRHFGSTRVLRGLDLDVQDGEHVAITGANGSGKTTLLRILSGLLRPSSGDVTVLGGAPGDPDVRPRVGVVGHAPAIYTRMTASENIRFWTGLYAVAPARGYELLHALGLDPADTRPAASYSQGMRQRVSIAIALSTSPELVVADEPFAGLDGAGAGAVAALLRDVPTLVVATHGDADGRQLHLRDGRLTA